MRKIILPMLLIIVLPPDSYGGTSTTRPAPPATRPVPEPLRKIVADLDPMIDTLPKRSRFQDQLTDFALITLGQFLEAVAESKDPAQLVDQYIAAFPSGSDRIDLCLIMMTAHLTPGAFHSPWRGFTEPQRDRLMALSTLIAEIQFKRMQKESAYTEALYRVSLWSGMLLSGGADDGAFNSAIPCLNARFEQDGKASYWPMARDFALLAHVVSRDDLAKNLSPLNLKERVLELFEWKDSLQFSKQMLKRSDDGLRWAAVRIEGRPTLPSPLAITSKTFAPNVDLQPGGIQAVDIFWSENSK